MVVLQPRGYQRELVELVWQTNAIVTLPTGGCVVLLFWWWWWWLAAGAAS
jgi:hypothetical protein